MTPLIRGLLDLDEFQAQCPDPVQHIVQAGLIELTVADLDAVAGGVGTWALTFNC